MREQYPKEPERFARDTPLITVPPHHALVDTWMKHLNAAAISHYRRERISKSLKTVMDAIGPRMRELAIANIKQPPTLYPDFLTLTREAHRRWPDVHPEELASGFYDRELGELHLGEGHTGHEGEMQTIHAHELGHAVDGPLEPYSNHPQWLAAWKHEIARPGSPMSARARHNPHEGFAEYIRHVGTGKLEKLHSFPEAKAFFKTQGLHEIPI
jgi:hypothetical protein